MPIYDFRCRACGLSFDALVRGSASPACPTCQSADLERQPSLFAVSSESTRASAIKAGRQRLAELERGTAAQRREVVEKHDD
jgi:putative FmdB family regulatory protein